MQVCRLRARSAQELLDQRGAELLQAGPTHARGGAGPQPVDQDQLFGREAELGDRKSNRKSHSNPELSSCCRNLTYIFVFYLIPGRVSVICARLLTPALLSHAHTAMVVIGVFIVPVVVPSLVIQTGSQVQALHQNLQICASRTQEALVEKRFEGVVVVFLYLPMAVKFSRPRRFIV